MLWCRRDVQSREKVWSVKIALKQRGLALLWATKNGSSAASITSFLSVYRKLCVAIEKWTIEDEDICHQKKSTPPPPPHPTNEVCDTWEISMSGKFPEINFWENCRKIFPAESSLEKLFQIIFPKILVSGIFLNITHLPQTHPLQCLSTPHQHLQPQNFTIHCPNAILSYTSHSTLCS